jgi:hypothetical protein
MTLLPLPIAPPAALAEIIDPALRLLSSTLSSNNARALLLAITLQESSLAARVQGGNGPARGLWQFEQGGVRGVLGHPASAKLAVALCVARGVPTTVYGVYSSLPGDDLLACGFARLLLLTDPLLLPGEDDANAAFAYYQRNWRPGAWDRGTPADREALKARFIANYTCAWACVRYPG